MDHHLIKEFKILNLDESVLPRDLDEWRKIVTYIRKLNSTFEESGHQAQNTHQDAYTKANQSQAIESQEIGKGIAKAPNKLQAVIAALSDGLFAFDKKGELLFLNTAAEHYFGGKESQFVGKCILDRFELHSMDKKRLLLKTPNLLSILAAQNTFRDDNAYLHRFDGDLSVSCVISPIQDNQSVVGFVFVFRDVSERERYERALHAEKERAQVTLHSIGDGVITTDRDGYIEYMNPIAQALTGCTLEKARGNLLGKIFNVYNERMNVPVENPVTQCLQFGQSTGRKETGMLLGHAGQRHAIQHTASPIRDHEDNIQGAVLVFHDVTERRRMVKQMSHQAKHDALTGLINRREFERRLHQAVLSTSKNNMQHTLCYLDVDQFKLINDTSGHTAGDVLLKQLAVQLSQTLRSRDTLARLGGDEFCLLLENCPLNKGIEVANGLINTLKKFKFKWEEHTYEIAASIGLVLVNDSCKSFEELMTHADLACYAAKDLGRNRIYVYRNEDIEITRRHSEILRAAELTNALNQDRFILYYQPIVSLEDDSNKPFHYEILLRMLDEEGNIVLPNLFIPAAERYGQMPTIDRWVIRTAFNNFAELYKRSPGVGIAINLSGNSVGDESLSEYIFQTLNDTHLRPENICFEITETAAIGNLQQAADFITKMREKGFRFALDDFGSGLSSFTYLKTLPVDYLKIDGSFVQHMVKDSIDHAMVAAINQVGNIMGIPTIAEFVESPEIIEKLKKLGVNYAQGYAVGRPVPLEQIGIDQSNLDKKTAPLKT